MNLKSFVIGSILIHIVGGLLIYFYYNPIHLSPQLVEEELQEKLKEEMTEELHSIPKVLPPQKLSKPENPNPLPALNPPTQNPSEDLKADQLGQEKQKPENLKAQPTNMEKLSDLEPLAKKNLIKGGLDSMEGAEKEDLSQELEIVEPPIKPVIKSALETGLEIQEAQESEELEEIEETEDELERNLSPKNLETETIKAPNNSSHKLSDNSFELPKKERNFYQLVQKSKNPDLDYPDFARRAGMEGRLVIRFFVDENGFVDQMNLEKSSGHSELDNYILRLLSSYEFETKGVWVRFDQVFKLEGQEKEFSRNSFRRE